MKIAYLDCPTGISGDMTLGALIDVGVDLNQVRSAIDSLQLPDVKLQVATVVKGGFRATKVDVIHPEQHAHRHLSDIKEILDRAGDGLTASQKDLALRIFQAVAEAEAHVHGMSVDSVHFHEVGAIDSIVDIVGAAAGFDLLGVDRIVCSHIPTGRGEVNIDHGICQVPTPGTAELLKGIPLRDVPVDAELTTPTGAAIVKTVADSFGALPEMSIERIGYGSGTMDFPNRANLLRLFIGEAITSPDRDVVSLLETNLDDVSGEVIGHTKQLLLKAGALDVYSTPIQMKKDRPGTILSVITRPSDTDKLEEILFSETGTLGIRRSMLERSTQSRQPHSVETVYGPVEGKLAWQSGGRASFSPEYESCAEQANQQGVSLREVYRAATSAYDASEPVTPKQSETSTKPVPHSHDHDHDHRHDHDHG